MLTSRVDRRDWEATATATVALALALGLVFAGCGGRSQLLAATGDAALDVLPEDQRVEMAPPELDVDLGPDEPDAEGQIDLGPEIPPPPDAGSPSIGAACDPGQGAAECGDDPEALCLGGDYCSPGFCSRSCDAGDPCPTGSVCAALETLDDTGAPTVLHMCFLPCDNGLCPDPNRLVCDIDRQICGDEGYLFNLGSLGARKADGTTCASSPPPPVATFFGRNLAVSDPAAGAPSEPIVAVDPVDPRVFYVAYNASGSGSVVSATIDAGQTWRHTRVGADVDPMDIGDPVLAVDPGTRAVWHGYITALGGMCAPGGNYPGRNAVHVVHSEDFGKSWSPPVAASAPRYTDDRYLVDKPWMAIAHNGTIHLSFLPYPTDGASDFNVVVASSSDGGASWINVVANDDSLEFRELAGLATDARGGLYAIWYELTGVYFTRSDDGGATFSHPSLRVTSEDLRYDDPTLAVSPSGDRIYVVWSRTVPGGGIDANDVRAAVSVDGGLSFGPPLTLNDDPGCATHWHPAAAADDAGRLWAIWYDARWGDGRVRWAQADETGGAVRVLDRGWVTDAAGSFTTSRSNFFLGDYIGLGYARGRLWAAWGDLRDAAAQGTTIYAAGAMVP